MTDTGESVTGPQLMNIYICLPGQKVKPQLEKVLKDQTQFWPVAGWLSDSCRLSYFHRCFPQKQFLVAMAADDNQDNTRYSSPHRCCVHTHTAVSGDTQTSTVR